MGSQVHFQFVVHNNANSCHNGLQVLREVQPLADQHSLQLTKPEAEVLEDILEERVRLGLT